MLLRLAAVLLALTLAGCASDAEDPGVAAETAEPTTSAASPTPTPPASPASPEETAETETPTPTPTTEETPREPGLRGALLTADELPGLNDEFAWQVDSTRTREPRQPFGTCQEFSIGSIGAMDVVVRSYRPAEGDGATAGHLVAEFPDEETAQRAYAVIRSWAADCADDLADHRDVQVGRVQPVAVADADAGWHLLIYGPVEGEREAGYFDAQGFTRVGATISLLEMRSIGQDYNYPRGQEPMAVAVEVAASLLSSS